MSAKRHIPLKGKPKFAVVVDGETEFWYVQMMKRNEKQIKVDIKPEIPQKKKLPDQYSKVIELSKSYDKVFWIVDLDTILHDSLSAPKGKKNALDTFLQYKAAIEKNYKHINVVINQPCLEFWFLTHFEAAAPLFSNCDEASLKLKKHLNDYEKTEKYFTKQDKDIYQKLKPLLPGAISNAKRLPAFDRDDPNRGLSEMYTLFEDIGLF